MNSFRRNYCIVYKFIHNVITVVFVLNTPLLNANLKYCFRFFKYLSISRAIFFKILCKKATSIHVKRKTVFFYMLLKYLPTPLALILPKLRG